MGLTKRTSRGSGVLVPNIIEKGLNPLAMENESSEGFSYDAEPEFKERLVDEDDLFNDASDILDESSTSINSSVGRIPNSFLAMETLTSSSTSLSKFVTRINTSKR